MLLARRHVRTTARCIGARASAGGRCLPCKQVPSHPHLDRSPAVQRSVNRRTEHCRPCMRKQGASNQSWAWDAAICSFARRFEQPSRQAIAQEGSKQYSDTYTHDMLDRRPVCVRRSRLPVQAPRAGLLLTTKLLTTLMLAPSKTLHVMLSPHRTANDAYGCHGTFSERH